MNIRFALLAVGLAFTAACGGSSGPTTPTASTGGTTGGTTGGGTTAPTSTNSVSVANNHFDPANIQVAPGTTVTWSWASGASTHNVTFADGGSSGDKATGSYSRTFATAGTFTYACTLHGGMNGSVLVK
jgi:plastocyanin